MAEDTVLRQLARVLWDCWDRILAADGKQEFESDYGDVTARNMYYKLTADFVDEDRWDAELLMGLCERLGGKYDETSLWEIHHELGCQVGERP